MLSILNITMYIVLSYSPSSLQQTLMEDFKQITHVKIKKQELNIQDFTDMDHCYRKLISLNHLTMTVKVLH